MISMEDGTRKRADQIKIGDRLPIYGNRVLTVDNVYIGDDEEIVCVKTNEDHEIYVSVGHPLLKENGKRAEAQSLKADDKIITEKNTLATVTHVEIQPYAQKVYNYSFEGEEVGNYVIADGLYSGDFYAQNMLEEEKRELSEDEKKLIEELDRFTKSRKGVS